MIVARREGAIATIALDRAAARNALSAAGWDALAERIAAAAASDAAAVLLASDVPGIFSAGADLTMLDALRHDVAARAAFRERMARAVDGLSALPMPTIAVVDGGCYGAAVALVLACDVVVAGARAGFAVTPAKLGILYPPRDLARLAARVGRGQAARMIFTGAAVDADEACRIGLTDVRADAASAVATRIAEEIAGNAPCAVRGLKQLLAGADDGDARFDAAFGTAAFADRLAAFRSRAR